jgi:hypothetical protein
MEIALQVEKDVLAGQRGCGDSTDHSCSRLSHTANDLDLNLITLIRVNQGQSGPVPTAAIAGLKAKMYLNGDDDVTVTGTRSSNGESQASGLKWQQKWSPNGVKLKLKWRQAEAQMAAEMKLRQTLAAES